MPYPKRLMLLILASARCSLATEADGIPALERLLDDILVRAVVERTVARAASAPVREPGLEMRETPFTGTVPHPLVNDFVRYFTGIGAKGFRGAQVRLEPYREMIERVLQDEGLPAELLWVGLVESGFNPDARSPKNAVGIWQLVPETAERFGLVLSGRDERTDPLKSTRAAAKYLKLLYARFGDWPLALAAYNAGEHRIQLAIDRANTTDFWRLREVGVLPRETQAYVPAVLAAQLLSKHRSQETRTAHDFNERTEGNVVFAPYQITR